MSSVIHTIPSMSFFNIDKEQSQESLVSWQPSKVVSLYATLAGLTGLLPIPFVDDWLYSKVRRRMLASLLKTSEKPVPDSWLLCFEEPSLEWSSQVEHSVRRGLKVGLFKLVFLPLRKVLRKLLYLLAIRDCLHRSTQIFCEGYLVLEAKKSGYLNVDGEMSSAELKRLYQATQSAIVFSDMKPTRSLIKRMFSRSWGALSSIAWSHWRAEQTESSPNDAALKKTTLMEKLQQELQTNARFTRWFEQFSSMLWGERQDMEALKDNFHFALRQ